jgi:hypothetical protein
LDVIAPSGHKQVASSLYFSQANQSLIYFDAVFQAMHACRILFGCGTACACKLECNVSEARFIPAARHHESKPRKYGVRTCRSTVSGEYLCKFFRDLLALSMTTTPPQVAGLTTMLSAKGRVCGNKVFIIDKLQALRDRLKGYIEEGARR